MLFTEIVRPVFGPLHFDVSFIISLLIFTKKQTKNPRNYWDSAWNCIDSTG